MDEQAPKTKPAGKAGQVEIGEAGKTGLAAILAEPVVQAIQPELERLAHESTNALIDGVAGYPLMTRLGVIAAVRLSIAVGEHHGSVGAGLKVFGLWLRAQAARAWSAYRRWRKRGE